MNWKRKTAVVICCGWMLTLGVFMEPVTTRSPLTAQGDENATRVSISTSIFGRKSYGIPYIFHVERPVAYRTEAVISLEGQLPDEVSLVLETRDLTTDQTRNIEVTLDEDEISRDTNENDERYSFDIPILTDPRARRFRVDGQLKVTRGNDVTTIPIHGVTRLKQVQGGYIGWYRFYMSF